MIDDVSKKARASLLNDFKWPAVATTGGVGSAVLRPELSAWLPNISTTQTFECLLLRLRSEALGDDHAHAAL
jgi:hypothetical protein